MALSEKYGAKRAYSRAADLVAWEEEGGPSEDTLRKGGVSEDMKDR